MVPADTVRYGWIHGIQSPRANAPLSFWVELGRMTVRSFLAWSWLLVTPLVLGGATITGMGYAACIAERHVAFEDGIPSPWICVAAFDVPAEIPKSVSSGVDVATMRITIVGAIAAVFFGLFALYSVYPGFYQLLRKERLAKREAGRLTFSCGIDERTGDVVARVRNGHRYPFRQIDLTLAGRGKRLPRAVPSFSLKPGASHASSIFAGQEPRQAASFCAAACFLTKASIPESRWSLI